MREELRHAHTMEIRGLVAGSTVHDFNNLLTIISGYGELLADELPDGPARDAAAAIVATTGRASALTSQLQAIGRTQNPEPVVVNPTIVVESNAEVIERILGEAIDMRWSGPDEPCFVRVDADRFEQTLLNLVINARDAMPDGGTLVIDLRCVNGRDLAAGHRVERHGRYVVITVTDTGSGMDETTLAHCFDPLFTTKGPYAGTGLGLAAARRFVEESHGSVLARSEVGVGSAFELVLPAVDAPVAVNPVSPVTAVTAAEGVRTPRATVLVAEDDGPLRSLIVQVLRRNGLRVLEAASGEAALDLLDGSVDLLVSDVVMGGLSGVDLARRVPVAGTAPAVLLVSGTADPSVLEELSPRICDFLAKPFRPSQLVDRVVALLARRADTSR
jgi:CheY-like chemotaxis protein